MFVSDSPPHALQQHTTFECRAFSFKSSVILLAISCIKVNTRLVGFTRVGICTGMVSRPVIPIDTATSPIVEVRVLIAFTAALGVADVVLPDDVALNVVQFAMGIKVVV